MASMSRRVLEGGVPEGAEAFQIDRTPPDERCQKQKVAEAKANAEVTLLVLTPFTNFPKVAFEHVKLGKTAVRKITVQNPSEKPVQVSLEAFHSQNGFEVDYDCFTLGPQEETTLQVGWVPQKGGNLRERVSIKYNKNVAQVFLVASCLAPVEKPTRRLPLQTTNNVPKASKLASKASTIPLPDNPVKRLTGQQPPTRPLPDNGTEIPPPTLKSLRRLPAWPEPSWSPQKLGVGKTNSVEPGCHQQQPQQGVLTSARKPLSPLKSNGENLRRETFVKGGENLRRETFIKDGENMRRETFVKESGNVLTSFKQFQCPVPMHPDESNYFAVADYSFISSTPAGVKRANNFKEVDVSAIRNVRSLPPQPVVSTTEKRSSCKELRFSPLPPEEGTENLVPLETFAAADVPQLAPAPEDDYMTTMDVSNMLQAFIAESAEATNVFDELQQDLTPQARLPVCKDNIKVPSPVIPPPSEQDMNVSMLIQQMMQESYHGGANNDASLVLPMSDSRETYVVGANVSLVGDFSLEDLATPVNAEEDFLAAADFIHGEKLELIDEKYEEEQKQEQTEAYVPDLQLSGACVNASMTNLGNSLETYIVGELSPRNLSPPPQGRRTEASIAVKPTFETFQVTPPKSKKQKNTTLASPPPAATTVSVLKSTKRTVAKHFPSGLKKRLTLIKPVRDCSSVVVRHPNPFASKNLYYDEKWAQKQQRGFQKWLNFVLTPNAFDESDEGNGLPPGKLDIANLWKACSSDVRVPRAPTREVLSMRAYATRRVMNRLRRHACALWQSPDIAQVVARVEFEIEKKRFLIRPDKSINKDVGLKQKFLELLLTYNPLWLTIGLETVFGEILVTLDGVGDILGLSRFIITRFLANPDIQQEYAHATVPHHYKPGCDEALKQWILKKFLQLVFFLDKAKSYSIIKHDPCLFCKDDSKKKMSSAEMLTTFSRDFLAGEGDVIKHLAYLGYEVTHKQTHLDEFDYAVNNFAVDLTDGIRLCRVIELLHKEKLSNKLRVPAQTLSQKTHNVGISLACLKKSARGLPDNITAKDIVYGHKEKTLALVWHIIFGFQLDTILNEDGLRKEVKHLEKSLSYRVQIGDTEAKRGFAFVLEAKQRDLVKDQFSDKENDWALCSKVKLLTKWARLVCAHYGVQIDNLTVSFSDGRALCFLLHHYHPSFLPRSVISMKTSASLQSDESLTRLDCSPNDSFGAQTYSYAQDSKLYEELLRNEKNNFKVFHDKATDLGGVPLLIRSSDMSNTIPDQKVTTVFLTYLAARLLDLSKEMTAARTIQLAWRRHHAIKTEKEIKVLSQAAVTIQQHFRVILAKRLLQKRNSSAAKIQHCFKRYIRKQQLVQEINRRILEKKRVKMVSKLQCCVRRHQKRQQLVQEINRRILQSQSTRSAITLQRFARGFLARQLKKCLMQEKRARQVAAVRVLQKNWRCLQFKTRIEDHIQKKKLALKETQRMAAITLQQYARGFLARQLKKRLMQEKKARQVAAVRVLQKNWRCLQFRTRIEDHIQKKKLALKETQRMAAITLQQYARGFLARQLKKRLMQEKRARQVAAVRVLQKNWRCLQFRTRIEDHIGKKLAFKETQRMAAITLQQYARGFLARQLKKRLMQEKRARQVAAVRVLQKNWRCLQFRTRIEDHIQKKKLALKETQRMAAITLQQYARGFLARQLKKRLMQEKRARQVAAVRVLQKNWRCLQFRTRIEDHIGKKLALKETQRMAAITLQQYARGFLARQLKKRLMQEKRARQVAAVRVLQKNWRCLQFRTRIEDHIGKKLAFKETQRMAAITLQQYARGFLARQLKKRLMQEKRARQVAAVRVLQKNWRCLQFRTRIEDHIGKKLALKETQRMAAITLQQYARGFLARQLKKRLMQEKKARQVAAVRVLQKNWRCLQFRTRIEDHIGKKLAFKETQRMAAITLQQYARGFLARQLKKRLMQEKRARQVAAVRVLQKNWRCLQFRTRIEDHIQKKKLALKETQRMAAITLQQYARGFLARQLKKRLMQEKRARQVAAVRVLQKNWRCLQFKTRIEDHIQKKKLALKETQRMAAITLQQYVRGFLARQLKKRLMQEKRARQVAAVRVLQKNWRCLQFRTRIEDHIGKKLAFKETQRMAAITLQQYAQGFLARQLKKRLMQEKRARQVAAVRVLQKNWRCLQFRTRIEDHIRKKQLALQGRQMKAAITLQCHVRGFLARQLKKHLIKERNTKLLFERCVVFIQSIYRMLKYRREYLKQQKAAVAIQSCFRGHRVRIMLAQKEKAAITLQCYARGFLARQLKKRLIQEKRARQVAAVRVLQKNWQCLQFKTRIEDRIQKRLWVAQMRTNAAVSIQYHFRRLLKRKQQLALEEDWKMMAAITLQRYVRGFLARQLKKHLMEEKRTKQNAAVRVLQKNWRCLQFRTRIENHIQKIRLAQMHNRAAIVIQCCFKKYLRRKQQLVLEERQRKAAITLQRYVRGFLAREIKKHLMEEKSRQVIRVLRNFFLLGKKVALVKLRVRSAAVIQQYFRRHLKMKQQLALEEMAALTLQSHVRGFLARQLKKRLIEEKTTLALQLQMEQDHKVLFERRVVFIQSVWRMLKFRREYLKRRKAAVAIQSCYRGHRVRLMLAKNDKEAQMILAPSVDPEVNLGKLVEEARQRVKEVTENAQESDRLCNRTKFALDYLYKSKDMAHLLKVLRDLDVSTRFSCACCDRLIDDDSTCILLLVDLIKRTNRSVPHMELISTTFDIFLNLAKYKPSLEVMAKNCEKVALTIVEFLWIYREKSAEIFSKGCSVLWTLAHHQVVKQFLHTQAASRRLKDIYACLTEKHNRKVAEERKKRGSLSSFPLRKGSTSSKSSCKEAIVRVRKPELSASPAWKNADTVARYLSEPYSAIQELMKILEK